MTGPIDYIILGFQGNNFDGSILRELESAAQDNIVRVLDLVFVIKDAQGNVIEGEYEDQSPELKEMFGNFAVDTDSPLLTDDDIARIGEQMPTETAAAVLIIEHVWAINLKQAIAAAGGFVVGDGRIHPERIQAAMQELEQSRTTEGGGS